MLAWARRELVIVLCIHAHGETHTMRRKSMLFFVLGVLLLVAAASVAAMSLAPGSNSLLKTTAAPQAATTEATVPMVVAQLDIAKGTLLDNPAELLRINEVPASQFNQETQFNDIEALRNMVATADIKAGDSLRKSTVHAAGLAQKIPAPAAGQPALKAFPVQVNSLSGVADLIQPGDFVDVVASFNMDVTTLRPGVPQSGENGGVKPGTYRTNRQRRNVTCAAAGC